MLKTVGFLLGVLLVGLLGETAVVNTPTNSG